MQETKMYLLIFLIVGFPLVEIFVMLKIGGIIGALNTILLIIFTALFGLYCARVEGLNTLKSGMSQLVKNQMPFYEIISGATIAFAALFLIIPGFITDILGFLLIIPFTRNILINMIASKFSKKNTYDNTQTIEGEYEEKNDD